MLPPLSVYIRSEVWHKKRKPPNPYFPCRTPVAKNARRDETPENLEKRVQALVAQPLTAAGRENFTKIFFDGVARQGVVCLSTQPANMLMWSHYAESHKGIALRFNVDMRLLAAELPGRWVPVPVHYAMQYPKVNWFELSERPTLLMSILGTKAKAWEHEQE
jgi:hypothetical protein